MTCNPDGESPMRETCFSCRVQEKSMLASRDHIITRVAELDEGGNVGTWDLLKG